MWQVEGIRVVTGGQTLPEQDSVRRLLWGHPWVVTQEFMDSRQLVITFSSLLFP